MAYLIDIRLFLFAWTEDYIFFIYLSTFFSHSKKCPNFDFKNGVKISRRLPGRFLPLLH